MSSKPAVSFIGLGAMGFGMATNLIKEGWAVTGFDVWPPTLERFRAAGGSTASSPAETVASAPFCVCMVATAQQAQAVLFGDDDDQTTTTAAAVPALPRDVVLLLCSTVPSAYVQDLQRQLEKAGRGDVHLIDAPVSGGAIRAADGTLSIMAGGSDEAIAKGRDLLQAMSDPKKLYIVKGGVGAGSNMKMCHQVLAANQILSASEGVGFAAHLGLDLKQAGQGLVNSTGWSWMLENRLPRIVHPEHQPLASALTIILKDTAIITSEARRYDFPTPMTGAAEQAYLVGLGRGFGPEDDGGLIRIYTEGKGKVGPVKGLADTDEAKLKRAVALLQGIHLCSAAEALAFAHRVGLDLAQVFELCINAAGGSKILQAAGPAIMEALKNGTSSSSSGNAAGLREIVDGLRDAVDEAQRLKVPLFLGSTALGLLQLVLKSSADGKDDGLGRVVDLWRAS